MGQKLRIGYILIFFLFLPVLAWGEVDTLYPNGDGGRACTEYPLGDSGYLRIDDDPSDPDDGDSMLTCGSGTCYDYFNLADFTPSGVSSIDTVIVHYRCMDDGIYCVYPTADVYVRASIKIDSDSSLGEYRQIIPTPWTNYADTFTTAPGGGDFDEDNLDDMTLGVYLYTKNSTVCIAKFTYAYAEVIYTSAGLSQSLTCVETTHTSIKIEDDYANETAPVSKIVLMCDQNNPPTTRVDSVTASITDPDTLEATSLAESTLYYYRTELTDAATTDTSSVGSVTTECGDYTAQAAYGVSTCSRDSTVSDTIEDIREIWFFFYGGDSVIQVRYAIGTSAGDSDFYKIDFTEHYCDSGYQVGDSIVISDADTLKWRTWYYVIIMVRNECGVASGWSDPVDSFYLLPISPPDWAWYDSCWNNRAAIYFGTDHDTLFPHKLIRLPWRVGVIQEGAWSAMRDEGITGDAILHRKGDNYTHISFQSSDVTRYNNDDSINSFAYIVTRNHTNDSWCDPELVDTLQKDGNYDSHFALYLGMDSSQYRINMFGDCHLTDSIRQWRSYTSQGACSFAGWTPKAKIPVYGTYPLPRTASNGDMYVEFRGCVKDSCYDCQNNETKYASFVKSVDNGSTWTLYPPVIFDTIGNYTRAQLYSFGFGIDSNDTLYLAFTFANAAWDSTRTAVAKSGDGGIVWVTLDGADTCANVGIKDKIYRTEATTVDSHNIHSLMFLDNDTLLILTGKNDAFGEGYGYLNKWNGSGWDVDSLTEETGLRFSKFRHCFGVVKDSTDTVHVFGAFKPRSTRYYEIYPDGDLDTVVYKAPPTWEYVPSGSTCFYCLVDENQDETDSSITYCKLEEDGAGDSAYMVYSLESMPIISDYDSISMLIVHVNHAADFNGSGTQACTLEFVIGVDGDYYYGGKNVVAKSYTDGEPNWQEHSDTFIVNPSTSNPWTKDEIDTLRAGMRLKNQTGNTQGFYQQSTFWVQVMTITVIDELIEPEYFAQEIIEYKCVPGNSEVITNMFTLNSAYGHPLGDVLDYQSNEGLEFVFVQGNNVYYGTDQTFEGADNTGNEIIIVRDTLQIARLPESLWGLSGSNILFMLRDTLPADRDFFDYHTYYVYYNRDDTGSCDVLPDGDIDSIFYHGFWGFERDGYVEYDIDDLSEWVVVTDSCKGRCSGLEHENKIISGDMSLKLFSTTANPEVHLGFSDSINDVKITLWMWGGTVTTDSSIYVGLKHRTGDLFWVGISKAGTDSSRFDAWDGTTHYPLALYASPGVYQRFEIRVQADSGISCRTRDTTWVLHNTDFFSFDTLIFLGGKNNTGAFYDHIFIEPDVSNEEEARAVLPERKGLFVYPIYNPQKYGGFAKGVKRK